MLLVIGFPIAVLIAWAFELTPEGLKVTAPDPDAAMRSEWHWADSALAVALLAIAAAMIWSQVTTGPDIADVSASPIPAERSIAVLPFADMSPEGDQAYFGDGIAEELLDELTRLEGLRVASRTSSFGFRDGGADSREIAKALNTSRRSSRAASAKAAIDCGSRRSSSTPRTDTTSGRTPMNGR